MQSLLRLLLWLHIPYLLAVSSFVGWLIYLLVHAVINLSCVWAVAALLILFLGVLLLQVLWSLKALLEPVPQSPELELKLPRPMLKGVSQLVAKIAVEQDLLLPDEIRVGADKVVHAYEDRSGKRVLVLGGLAVAVFSQSALKGVIAHELAGFSLGDTRLTRRASGRLRVMETLEQHFHQQPTTKANPFVWLIRLYHLVFRIAWCANSRRQEFAADRRQAQRAGKYAAASALLNLVLAETVPWVRLSNIAKTYALANEQMELILSDYWRRARVAGNDDWVEACRKELKKVTRLLNSQASLQDRLKAMGVSPEQAHKLILEQGGTPARELFSGWETIEKLLTDQLVANFQAKELTMDDLAQILQGRLA